MKRKMVSMLVLGGLVFGGFTTSVSAGEIALPVYSYSVVADEKFEFDGETFSTITGSFSGSTGTMNSLNGNPSAAWNISSGSTHADARVTGVTVNTTVSNGSARFTLHVQHPNGRIATRSVGSSGSVNLNDFNGIDAGGTWRVWISTDGVVSTATARMTVNHAR